MRIMVSLRGFAASDASRIPKKRELKAKVPVLSKVPLEVRCIENP